MKNKKKLTKSKIKKHPLVTLIEKAYNQDKMNKRKNGNT